MTIAKLDISSPRASRKREARPLQPQSAAAPGLDRIAFAGNACVMNAQRAAHIEVICWPIVASAWTTLIQAWEGVHAARGVYPTLIDGTSAPSTWLRTSGPRLSLPFRNTPAEESSVAAIVRRSAMQMVAVIHESREPDAGEAGLQAFAQSMAAFDELGCTAGRSPCAVVVARGNGASSDQQRQYDFARRPARLRDPAWNRELQLKFWEEGSEPLPLELAHVVAAAIGHYWLDSEASNPIFGAVQAKLAHTPFPLRRLGTGKRR